MKTRLISLAATILFYAASVTPSAARWVGKSAVCINGTWYYCAESGANLPDGGTASAPFHNANLGNISTLKLGGKSEVFEPRSDNPNIGNEWNGGTMTMGYKIDGGDAISFDLNYYGFSNNNNLFKFLDKEINISSLDNGEHTIEVWFGSVNPYNQNDNYWDNNHENGGDGNNYKATFTKIPTVTLPNTGNVESTLNSYSNQPACVILNGRTLYSDKWNTLCLPFNLSNFTGTPLDGADVRYLSSSLFEEGYLTLNFQSSNAIQAGIPYIVKLNGNSIENPTFDNVSITTTTASSSPTDFVKFQGCFSSASIEGNQYLYLGANSTLYYPSTSKTIDAFRAYFQLIGITAGDPTSAQGIKAINLNFGDDTNSIQTITNKTSSKEGYYTIDGRRLDGTPATAGIYIHNGRKVMIK